MNLKAVLQSDKEWKRDGLKNPLLIQRVFNLFQLNHLRASTTHNLLITDIARQHHQTRTRSIYFTILRFWSYRTLDLLWAGTTAADLSQTTVLVVHPTVVHSFSFFGGLNWVVGPHNY